MRHTSRIISLGQLLEVGCQGESSTENLSLGKTKVSQGKDLQVREQRQGKQTQGENSSVEVGEGFNGHFKQSQQRDLLGQL